MKNRIALVFFLFSAMTGFSQSPLLTIQGSAGKFYLEHTVVAKENWYSIGRLFNLPPHDIAGYNNMNFDKALDVGTVVKIPLTPVNFDQKQLKGSGESLVPIYHVVEDKEWIFKVSSIYNDVPVTSLERWNKIKRDDVKKGTSLIIGFLRVKTDLSPLAIGIAINPALSTAGADLNNKTATPADLPVSQAAKTDVANKSTTSLPPAKTAPASLPLTTASATGTGVIPVSNPSERVNNYAITHSNGGFFSAEYTPSGKVVSGQAGTFKSTSGWTDGKYYALTNGVPVGSIVRVSGSNGKTIYAKVLGQLPEMKESAGLLIRISNAASAELGLGEGKFPVDIKY